MTALSPFLPLDLPFDAPTPPLSENASRGLHWAQRNRRLHPWRDAAHWVVLNAMRQVRVADDVRPFPVTVEVILPFRTRQRRDPHNYVGTNVMAVVDGIVNAGLIPDDNPEWATVVEPATSIQPDRSEHLQVRLIITQRRRRPHGH
jgi:crossover junction endodeoxyribonuclease RusA